MKVIPFPNYLKVRGKVVYQGRRFETVAAMLKTLSPDEAERMAAFQARYGLEWVQRLRAAYKRQA